MSLVTSVPEANIWEEILKDFGRKQNVQDEDARSVSTTRENYDPSIHNPVFYTAEDKLSARVQGDCNLTEYFNPAVLHPATVGYSIVDKPVKSPPPTPPSPPDKRKCSHTEFLEHYIFPVLLPALEEMLKAAKEEKCFERKRTKFNACDFLTQYLYSNNPNHTDRKGTQLEQIPFVVEHWKTHPRPPLPKSLVWSEAEATLIVQSFWRGYKVRIEPEVQELRGWQREWAEENANIKERVDHFWAEKMPDAGEQSSKTSVKEPTTNSTDQTLAVTTPPE